MTEEQIKALCKWAIHNSQRPLTEIEKEVIKNAIDAANTVEELFAVALIAARIR